MAEKEQVFSSKMKYKGVFNYKDFYKFCYDWLTEETELDIAETKYSEKISGNTKEVDIEWKGTNKINDYFRFDVKVTFKILGLEEVEVMQDGEKRKTNKGQPGISVKGTLVRDYKGKYETNATKRFMRAIYEKWIIPSRIEQLEDKLISDCDEFLSQVKAYLDLEGKR